VSSSDGGWNTGYRASWDKYDWCWWCWVDSDAAAAAAGSELSCSEWLGSEMLPGDTDSPAWKPAEAGLVAGTYGAPACNMAVLAANFSFSISASWSLFALARRFWNQIFTWHTASTRECQKNNELHTQRATNQNYYRSFQSKCEIGSCVFQCVAGAMPPESL